MRKNLPTNFLPVLKTLRKALLPVMAFFLSSTVFAQVSYTTDVTSGCNNLTVKFTNTSTVGNAYKWGFGDGTTSVGKNVTHTYTNTGVFNVTMSAFDSSAGPTFVLKGNAPAGPGINVSGSSMALSSSQACIGEQISAYIPPNVTATWDFGDGSPTVNSMNVQHAYSVAGTYTITATGKQSCGIFTLSNKVVVSNSAIPSAAYNTNLNYGASACPGQAISYNPNNNQGKVYSWNFGDGSPISSVAYPSHSFSAVGKYVVSLTLTNMCGQTSTYKDTSRVSSVGYFPKSIPINTSTALPCPGDVINFNANYTALKQTWKFGNGDSSLAVSPNYAYKVAGTYTVTVRLFNACGKDTTVSKSVVVGSNNYWSGNPIINVNGPPTLTPGSNVNFYTNVSATKYIWNFGDGSPTATISNVSHTYNTVGTYTVAATLTNGCMKDTIIKTTVTIVANPVGFTVDVTVGCSPLKVNYTNTSTKGNFFKWNFGDGGTSQLKSPSYTYNMPGNYNNVRLDAYDTTGKAMNYLGTVYLQSGIIVNGGNISSSTDTACVSELVSFNLNPSGSSVSWDFGDGSALSTQQYPSHGYTTVGTYTIKATAAVGGCPSAVMTKKVVVSTTARPSAMFYFNRNVCPNEQVTFNAQNYNATKYLWNYGDGSPTTSSQTGLHIYAKIGAYAVTLTVTNACGNSGTFKDSIHVISNSPFSPGISINASSSVACPGDNINFNYNSNALYQVWRFGNGDSSTQFSPNYAYAKAGNYTVTLILTNGCGNSTSITKSITIGATLPYGPGASMQVNSSPVCPGGNVSFYSSTARFYLWNFGDLTSSSQSNPSHVYSKIGTYTVTLKLTNGCGKDTTISSKVVVDNTLTPTLNKNMWGVPSASACPNDSVLVYTYGGASYLFDFGDGYTTTKTTPFYDPKTNFTFDFVKHPYKSIGTYKIKLTYFNSCGKSATDSSNVTIGSSQPVSGGIAGAGSSGGSTTAQTCEPIGFIGYGGSSYKWKFGNGDSVVTNQTNVNYAYKTAGNYTVTLIVSNSCGNSAVYTKSVVIGSMSLSTLALTNVNCTNGSNGSVYTSVNGGNGPYTYLWSTGATTANVGNLKVGTYTLTVTDNNGCKVTGSYTIKLVPAPNYGGIAYLSINSSPVCPGATVNFYTATASAYLWNFGDTTATVAIQNPVHQYKSVGSRTVTVKLSNGCGTDTILSGIVKIDPTLVPVLYRPNTNNNNFGTTTPNACAKDSVVFYAIGGTSYLWNFGDGTSTTKTSPVSLQGGGTADITRHPYATVGSYTVKLTYFNQCGKSATDSFVVAVGAGQQVQGGLVAGNAYRSCEKISFTAFGGSSYKWKFGNGDSIVTNVGSVQYAYLKGGSYNVTVLVTNSCGNSASYNQNVSIQNMAASSSVVNALCNGGTGTINTNVTGGVSPFVYSWSSGATTANVSGLVAGTYTYTVSDANGCKVIGSATVAQPAAISIASSTVAATCGNANGSASVTVSGGIKPYTYLWNTSATTTGISTVKAGLYNVTVTDSNKCTLTATVGISNTAGPTVSTPVGNDETCLGICNGTASVTATGTGALTYAWSTTPIQTTANASKLCAGTYTVGVTDVNGCITTSSPVKINSKLMTLSTSSTNENCVKACDGTAAVTASGGVFPYTYSWNTGTVKTTQSVSGLCSGVYTATVKDAAGCSAAANVSIGSPAALTVSVSSASVSCNGASDGSATAIANGGLAPYTYSWSPSGGTGTAAFGLKAGAYTVTVVDAKACTQTATVMVGQPAAIAVVAKTNVAITCSGMCNGSAIANATGGTGNYSYTWNTNPVQTAQTAFGLCAGTTGYTVTVKDANGCNATNTVILSAPAPLSLTTSSTATGCGASTGTATVTSKGGTVPYSYSWNTTVVQKTATATGLASGAYTATVVDSNGCKATASVGVSNSTGPVVKLVSSTNVSCKGLCNGNATISATDVNVPLKYSWNTPGADTTAGVKGLCAGNYVVVVKNNVNCITALAVLITEPAAIGIGLSETDVLCKGGSNGSATATVTGGTAPYTYAWSPNGGTASTATGLAANSYSVAVTDANGCKGVSATIPVNEPFVLTAAAKANGSINCNGNCNGSVSVNVSGGTGPYSYSWNTAPVQTSVTAAGLCAGSYTVTIKDAKGCSTTATATIVQPAPIVLTTSNTASVCNKANGSASVAITSGGKAPFTYYWNNGAVTASIGNLSAGNYIVTVTDSTGCTQLASSGVSTVGGPKITSVSATNEKCFKSCDGTLSVAATGTSKLSYSWSTSNANFTANVAGVCAGSYSATVTDSLGCSATSASVTINRPVLFVIATSQKADTLFAGAAASYQWNLNGVAIVGATSSYYKMKAQGNYNVTAKDANGCTASSAAVSFIVTGVNNAPTVNDIHLYPNPTSEEAVVSYDLSKPAHVTLTLSDMVGREIRVYSEMDLAAGKYTEKMDLSALNLTSGVYLVQLKINNDLYRNRLSIVK